MKIQFYTYNFNINQDNSPSFKSKTSNITAECVTKLIDSGKTVKEIAAELGISVTTYYKLLRKYSLYENYTPAKLPDKLAKITKKEIEDLLNQNITIPKICEKYNITANAYYNLVELLGINNPKQELRKRSSKITKEQLQKCINEKLSIDEICERFGITTNIYYRLMEKYEILTDRKIAKQRAVSITKEKIEQLINDNTPYKEILNKLQITADIYNSLIAKFGIKSKSKLQKENIAIITKEKMIALLENGKSVKEICKELNIPERTYSRLLDKFGIVTRRKAEKLHIKSITKEQLQELVDRGLPAKEIRKQLKISTSCFYKLLKQHNIRYDYLHHYGEIKIPVERLREVANSGKTTKEISAELGCAVTTYHSRVKAAKVATVLRDSINKIEDVPIKELQAALNSGMTISEICSKFKITNSNHYALIRKYNLSTPHRESTNRIVQITKEQILELKKSGLSVTEICKVLNIGTSTYSRILKDVTRT